MKVLVVGSGAREDALACRLSLESEVAAVPGNPGTKRWGANLAGTPLEAARHFLPDLIVIGSEKHLAAGLADLLRVEGFSVFGPGAAGARIESSKTYAKALMNEYGIPTARVLDRIEGFPVVIKADGLSAGKGVTIAHDAAEAEEALRAGNVLVEEFLEGEEASLFALTDGERLHLLPNALDYKTLLDGNCGPQTGGMGAVSPAPGVTPEIESKALDCIFIPLLQALRERKIEFRGVIYAGVMIRDGNPHVLEFNCRFGDPEAQVILPRITGNLAETLRSVADGTLDARQLGIAGTPRVCVVLASGGYPGAFRTGVPVHGDPLRENIFVAGIKEAIDGGLVTSGGRVLSCVGGSREEAYALAEEITFEGVQRRRDIGGRSVLRRVKNI